MKLLELAPEDWFPPEKGGAIWVRGYFLPMDGEPRPEKSTVRVGDLVVARVFGTIQYFAPGVVRIEVDRQKKARFRTPPNAGLVDGPTGSYLLLIRPFDEEAEAPAICREALSEFGGLVAAFNGKSSVYQLLFENVIRVPDGTTQAYPGSVENPVWYGSPDVSPERLEWLVGLWEDIPQLEVGLQNRVRLSLRWVHDALHASNVDAFLRLWVAIETIALEDTTNIRPIKELLAQQYHLSVEEAEARFRIGEILNLRSRLVHEGQRLTVSGAFVEYLRAVFGDLLLATSGRPGRHAEEVVERYGLNLQTELVRMRGSGKM